MGDRAPNILPIESPIEADALRKPLDAVVGRLVENAAPRFVSHCTALRNGAALSGKFSD
jgi:hypothetical protein